MTTTNPARDDINESLNQLLNSTSNNNNNKRSFAGDESSFNFQKSLNKSSVPIPGDELDSAMMMPVEVEQKGGGAKKPPAGTKGVANNDVSSSAA